MIRLARWIMGHRQLVPEYAERERTTIALHCACHGDAWTETVDAQGRLTAEQMTCPSLRRSPPVNLQTVLQKYIIHVRRCEGTHFLEDDSRRTDSNDFRYIGEKLFTDAEWQELRRIAQLPTQYSQENW